MNTFTIEEIEQALQDSSQQNFYFKDWVQELLQSANHAIVTDYLTGKTNSLQGLQTSHLLNVYSQLIHLLAPVEQSTPKQQRLFTLFTDPVAGPFTLYFLQNKIIQDLYHHPSAERLKASQHLFAQLGYTQDEIFSLIAIVTFYYEQDKKPIPSSPVKEYLSKYIHNSKTLLVPGQMHHAAHYYNPSQLWNCNYFQLLEEAKPEFLPGYLEYGFLSINEDYINFLLHYKNGYYVNMVEELLRTIPVQELNRLQQKMMVTMSLYNHLPDRFTNAMKTVAQEYLSLFITGADGARWEGSYPLFHQSETNDYNNYLPFSVIATHYLLELKHEQATALINQWFTGSATIDHRVLPILYEHWGADSFAYIEKLVKRNGKSSSLPDYKQILNFVKETFQPSVYIPLLWEIGFTKSNSIKTFVADIIAAKDAEAETKAIALLHHKKAESRLFGAKILSLLPSEQSKQAILSILHKEQNDAARDLLLESIADRLPAQADTTFINEMIQGALQRGKLQHPVEVFLDETHLPPLYLKDGTMASAEMIRFFLYRMSRHSKMQSDKEGNYILQQIDLSTATSFALQLLKLYKDHHFKPEHKFLLAAAALLGNDEVTDKLRIITNSWIEEGRYKMAEHGVGALALQGSDKALRWVEWYSRKYRNKKANVGAAASAALEQAAYELNISTHELGDRIVPDFGFEGLYKTFTVQNEEYRAFIDSKFRLAFFNEDNKQLKSLPAAADTALKEEFKAIAKEIRDVVKSQSPRMEYYLTVQRRWRFAAWQSFFLNNPVMFIYATRLVWAVYSNNDTIATAFICNEDSTLINIDHEEVVIPDDAMVGMVYPTQLEPDLLQQWKQFLFDEKVEQVFPQLNRTIPDLTTINLNTTILHHYEGRQMQTGSIRSTLERNGWHKGPTGDGGIIESMRLSYVEKKLEAILEVEGVGAGFGWGMDEKLGRLYVIDTAKSNSRRDTYPKNEQDEKLVSLHSLPPIFLNEMLAAVESIKPVEGNEKTG
jgi:hypothetical protein